MWDAVHEVLLGAALPVRSRSSAVAVTRSHSSAVAVTRTHPYCIYLVAEQLLLHFCLPVCCHNVDLGLELELAVDARSGHHIYCRRIDSEGEAAVCRVLKVGAH